MVDKPTMWKIKDFTSGHRRRKTATCRPPEKDVSVGKGQKQKS